jgi:drug/metabolite transporter (DMT)-like permease
VFLVALPWFEPIRFRVTWRLLAALLVTGVVCTAVAFTIQAWAQQRTPAARVALIFALEPVSAAIVSYVVGGEVLQASGVLGALLILAGVLVVELKPGQRNISTAVPSI